ncbi:MAG: ComF family protein [Gemmatimonadetes bacterium]|nr:ComF family protein [Gemmatimonadota bacterium]
MNPSALAKDLVELLLPRGCLGCGDRIPPEETEGLVCPRCRTLLRPPPDPRCFRCDAPLGTGRPKGSPCLECALWPDILASARAAVVLEPPADALVHALKYGGWRSLANLMGRKMAQVCPRALTDPLIIPVPTTPGRRRTRGYNQAFVLAEAVAEEVRGTVSEALARPRGRTQVRLGPSERRVNVEGSFVTVPSSRSRIRGREVILIDDVLTTGATALSATGVLAREGASSVCLLTFARALPFGGSGGRQGTYF